MKATPIRLPSCLNHLLRITAFAVPFGVISIAGAVVLSYFAIQSASSAEPQQILVANISGFSVFAVVMGVLANICQAPATHAQGAEVGGLAPGLFFFSLNF